jgi:hypothetical protein
LQRHAKEFAVNQNVADKIKPNEARRRLVRGSFAAPAVLALSSGSALAASSSLRCFDNSPNGVDAPDSKNVFKVQRWTVTVGTTTTKLVKGADITTEGVLRGFSTSTYVGSKVWIDVATGLQFVVTTPAPTIESSPLKQVALRLVNVGTPTAPSFSVNGLARSSSSTSGAGKVMWGSCWSSFKP